MRFHVGAGLVALLHARNAVAQRIRPSGYCVDGCAASYGLILFEGTSTLNYYQLTCDTDVFTHSLYYCAAIYCTPDEVTKGLAAYNDTCKTYSPYYLPPYEEIVETVLGNPEKVAAVPRVAEGVTKLYDHPVVPDASFFAFGLETSFAFDSNINVSWYFGYACIGFWSLVLLIGMINRALVIARQHSNNRSLGEDAVSRPLYLPPSASTWLRREMILPGTFGGRVQYAFGGWCTIPPRLESLLLVLFILINFLFCFPAYHLFLGNLYYPKTSVQLARYVADRTGVLAIANLPAVWLFAARNDPFLWLTGWSFASYNRFHRWIARVATVEAIIHSFAYSAFDWIEGEGVYKSSFNYQYWYMGVMATVTMSFMLGFSLYWLRNKHYDFFLVIHIVLAIITLIALWYHVRIFEGEYSGFIWFCVAVWSFDRLLRILRIVFNSIIPRVTKGIDAIVTYDADADLIRLDVTDYIGHENARPGIFYYVYELASIRGYESHPFTLCSWTRDGPTESASLTQSDGLTKEAGVTERKVSSQSADGKDMRHTFLIRPYAGFTGRLRDKLVKSHEAQSIRMSLLLEGPYGDQIYLDRFSDVLVVAGGSGITAAVSHSCALLQNNASTTRIHIVWAVRQMSLVHNVLQNELIAVANHPRVKIDVYYTPDADSKEQPASIDDTTTFVIHDKRPDIDEVLAMDRQACTQSMAMVCCGPPSMADACRRAVCNELAAKGAGIEFINDTMGW